MFSAQHHGLAILAVAVPQAQGMIELVSLQARKEQRGSGGGAQAST
ncbi:hypothetical protein KKB43_01445 [Patescibacteria group bacterium]|nr:hypothetical protein [Patescibacteria group bacterium]MBU4579660.1 hypothetical protein [Patescibacteria group bacterium]